METAITWISEDKEWRVWTDNPAHARKIERVFGIEPYRTDEQENYTEGKFYILPDVFRPFAVKKNMNLTEERREELRTRFQRNAVWAENDAILDDSDD